MNTIRVLLVDDHAGFRSSLASFLMKQKGVAVVGEAINGEEAIEKAERLQPDLVLMDLNMPVRGGFEATQEIKRRSPRTRVVILSMHGGEFYRRMAWRHAADGFIDKASVKSDLLSVLFSAQRGVEPELVAARA